MTNTKETTMSEPTEKTIDELRADVRKAIATCNARRSEAAYDEVDRATAALKAALAKAK